MKETPVRFVLCADDFGIAPGVNQAILRLVEAEHLSATGCMLVGAHAASHAEALASFAERVDIGLHRVLTDFPNHQCQHELGKKRKRGRPQGQSQEKAGLCRWG